ncbi:hypothetical protein IGJ83_003425 [Enterococcus pernyi]|uniref:hypothetical protein n=1 Tax=Enterococcus mundtii TaxID=53346 RepID=UPI00188425FE|nr:hypothetical protein [Enterococcus mundtii]MBE9912090.1 hypothetical protein [Enterococcus mundtii]MDA9429879.1 hypothetical protein [Enterococcus mundtii 1A]UBM07183.1 hypothetical protein K9N66_15000 [Enterococcus mundtii]
MFNFSDFFSEFAPQLVFILALVAIVMAIGAFLTQGVGRAIMSILGVLVLIALIMVLDNAWDIGNWLKELFFDPNASMVLPTWLR